ncbi:MAG: hypothetical protein HN576_01120 [Bacteriovoracaceae bacterium]|jgi:hypothetical protein|nr:hypothetical protein [Bacteriovoracaceae bacterium]
MSFRKYDDSIKSRIIKSGNPNLFPELKIPRMMTALYWIKKAKNKECLDEINYDRHSWIK